MSARAFLSRVRALEAKAAREHLMLLQQARRDVLAALVDASGFRSAQLRIMLGEIDRIIAAGRASAQVAAARSVSAGFGLGVQASDAVILASKAKIILPDTFFGIARELLSGLVDVVTDQTRAIWSELGTRLKTQVRRAALGITDPVQAMVAIGKTIKDPKTFGNAMTRAEVIIRTEVGRVFEVSKHTRNEESDKRLRAVGRTLGKYWLPADYTDRLRDAHRDAGKRYNRANAIPIDEPFIVDGEELMYPLDPNGSPGNTINCRCDSPNVVLKA